MLRTDFGILRLEIRLELVSKFHLAINLLACNVYGTDHPLFLVIVGFIERFKFSQL